MRPKKLLIISNENGFKNQIVEGLAKKIFGDSFIVESIGSNPSDKLDPIAIDTMKELGVDISAQIPKSIESISNEFLSKLDFCIILCADEKAPAFKTRARKLFWPWLDTFNDTSETTKMESIRKMRDEIKTKLYDFKRELI